MRHAENRRRPVIVGVTCNLDERDARVRRRYAHAIYEAGALPALLAPPAGDLPEDQIGAIVGRCLDACDAIVLTGGDDPDTEPFGEPTHPAARRIHPDRQRFETALLRALDQRREMPVLGICLGMQMMALAAGGRLNQHMPEDTPTHADHYDDRPHSLTRVCNGSVLWEAAPQGAGVVTSWHRQAVRDPGRLRIVARAPDGVIEAIDDPGRAFYLGVQWHPERTSDPGLGIELFRRLVAAASR